MTDPDELGLAVVTLADILDAMSVCWAVGGSIASAAYGEPRATNDVDIVAVLTEEQARAFVAKLGADFYADADAAADAARRKSCFNVIDNRSFIKVDVFIPGHGPMGIGQLERRTELEVFPSVRPVPVLGPEDTVLQKLPSDRQWRERCRGGRSLRGSLVASSGSCAGTRRSSNASPTTGERTREPSLGDPFRTSNRRRAKDARRRAVAHRAQSIATSISIASKGS